MCLYLKKGGPGHYSRGRHVHILHESCASFSLFPSRAKWVFSCNLLKNHLLTKIRKAAIVGPDPSICLSTAQSTPGLKHLAEALTEPQITSVNTFICQRIEMGNQSQSHYDFHGPQALLWSFLHYKKKKDMCVKNYMTTLVY